MFVKKRKSVGRSTLGLIASGAATISIDQKMPTYRVRSTRGALSHDEEAIVGDARRAFDKYRREYA